MSQADTVMRGAADADVERALLSAIVAGSEEAIISKTLNGVVTSWNPAAERLFGWTAAEMIGEPILRIIPPELHGEEADILDKLRRGERFERFETTRLRKDGSRISVSLTISPIHDATPQVMGASTVVHDITERRLADAALAAMTGELQDREARLSQLLGEREQILESERAARSEAERLSHLKDEFLATLSHELRTPLNAVQGWTHVLLHGPTTEEQNKALTIIERNVRAQAQIISDLLDMSRIVAGKIALELQAIHLHQVVQSALDTVRQTAEARQIRITMSLDHTLGLMRGDPNRLQQALWNLLTNAIKFTPAGGSIHVVLERVGSQAEISVTDTGVGIRPDFLPFLFDRFRQADASTTRRYGGLGIGLSIVKSLVELHGGSVRVTSPGEDYGSTFTVTLPLSPVQAALTSERRTLPGTDQPAAESSELPRLEGARILVVDDEEDSRSLLVRILGDQGARCAAAGSAREALALLSGEHFDALLSDIGMPGMDGYELIRAARLMDARRATPLAAVAITAYARREDRQRSLLAGYHAHLSKPIETRELIATVAGLLRLTR